MLNIYSSLFKNVMCMVTTNDAKKKEKRKEKIEWEQTKNKTLSTIYSRTLYGFISINWNRLNEEEHTRCQHTKCWYVAINHCICEPNESEWTTLFKIEYIVHWHWCCCVFCFECIFLSNLMNQKKWKRIYKIWKNIEDNFKKRVNKSEKNLNEKWMCLFRFFLCHVLLVDVALY